MNSQTFTLLLLVFLKKHHFKHNFTKLLRIYIYLLFGGGIPKTSENSCLSQRVLEIEH